MNTKHKKAIVVYEGKDSNENYWNFSNRFYQYTKLTISIIKKINNKKTKIIKKTHQ